MRRGSATAILLLLAAALAVGVGAWWTESRRAPRTVPPASQERVRHARVETVDERGQITADEPAAADQMVETPPAAVPARPGRRRVYFDAKPRSGSLASIARDVLDENRRSLGIDRMPGKLVLVREFESLSGRHLRFVQQVGDARVHRSEVSVHIAPDGRPLLVNADVHPVEGVETVPALDAAAALTAVRALLKDDDEQGLPSGLRTKEPKLTILPEGRGGRLVYLVDAATDDESVRVFVDAATGVPVGSERLSVTAEGSARVFRPNPVFTRRDASLKDRGDDDQAILNNEREFVTLARLDGSGFLVGDWADTTATEDPVFAVSNVFTGYTRGQPEFEQVMVYYHVDRVQQRLQSLGITNANAEPQKCDAHAFDGDQSSYDLFTDTLRFGDGGVDDGEDGDIIAHEFGHAMQFDQVESFGLSGETGSLGEGFGDFLAVTMHQVGDTVYDPLVGSWDATSYSRANPPFLRRVDLDKVYPDDVIGQVHADGEIWSRFLWDLNGLLGADEALTVAVEAHFLYTPQAKFRDAANAVLLVNIALRDGDLDTSIRALLDARGLPFSTPVPTPLDEDEFEDNDSIDRAAPLDLGTYEDLLLADEDWYRVTVPANRRVNVVALFDAAAVDLNLEARLDDGTLVGQSVSLEPREELSVGAGPDGRVFLLRVSDGSTGIGAGGYSLTLTAAELEVLEPGGTLVLDSRKASLRVFRVPVAAAKVEKGRRLKVISKRLGRKGAVNDLRVSDPSGVAVFAFGDGRRKKGAKAVITPDVAGFWIVEVQPRGTAQGNFKLKVRHTR